MLFYPLVLLLKTLFNFVLEEMVLSRVWGKSGWVEIFLVQPTGPRDKRGWVEPGRPLVEVPESTNSPELQEKHIHWFLSSNSRHWIGGMMASTFAHFTCQLNFLGLIS